MVLDSSSLSAPFLSILCRRRHTIVLQLNWSVGLMTGLLPVPNDAFPRCFLYDSRDCLSATVTIAMDCTNVTNVALYGMTMLYRKCLRGRVVCACLFEHLV